MRVQPEYLLNALAFLHGSTSSSFKLLSDICVIDRPSKPNRFFVVYNLLSVKYQSRLFLRTSLPEGGALPSAVPIFSGADWMEREA